MGMTIDEIECALNSIKIVLEHTEKGYYPEQFKTHEECLKEVMNIAHKYQQLQVNYENRLKADLVVVLEDLLEEFEKLDPDYECNTYYAAIRDCSNLTQQKIDKLKENINK